MEAIRVEPLIGSGYVALSGYEDITLRHQNGIGEYRNYLPVSELMNHPTIRTRPKGTASRITNEASVT